VVCQDHEERRKQKIITEKQPYLFLSSGGCHWCKKVVCYSQMPIFLQSHGRKGYRNSSNWILPLNISIIDIKHPEEI